MRKCPINDKVQCLSTDDNFCDCCDVFVETDLKERTMGKQPKTLRYNQICLDFVKQQVANGASFEEAVRKIGYYPRTFTPPNCGSHVRVPKGQKEVLLEQLLEEVKRIKLILTVGKEI